VEALCCIFIFVSRAASAAQQGSTAAAVEKLLFLSRKEADTVALAPIAPLQFNLRNSHT
jgi:hypothetical protein